MCRRVGLWKANRGGLAGVSGSGPGMHAPQNELQGFTATKTNPDRDRFLSLTEESHSTFSASWAVKAILVSRTDTGKGVLSNSCL